MKVELELNKEQLSLLDGELKNLVLSLTEKQQTELLQNYINTQLESFRTLKQGEYWNSSSRYEYTDFGKQITDKMSDKIGKAITNKMLSNEEITKYIDEVITEVQKNLQNTIETAISDYIVGHLFTDRDTLSNMIRNTIYDMRNNKEI